jgi:hypothetical protein
MGSALIVYGLLMAASESRITTKMSRGKAVGYCGLIGLKEGDFRGLVGGTDPPYNTYFLNWSGRADSNR